MNNNTTIPATKHSQNLVYVPKTGEQPPPKKQETIREPLSLPHVLDQVAHTIELNGKSLTISLSSFFDSLEQEMNVGLSFSSPLLPDLLSSGPQATLAKAKKMPILPPLDAFPQKPADSLPFLSALATKTWKSLSEEQKKAIKLPDRFKQYHQKSKEEQWPIYLRFVVFQETTGSDWVHWRFGPFFFTFRNKEKEFLGTETVSFPIKKSPTFSKDKIFSLGKSCASFENIFQAVALKTFFGYEIENETKKKIDLFLKKTKQKITPEMISRAFPGWGKHDRSFLLFFLINLFDLTSDGNVFTLMRKDLLNDYFREEAVSSSPLKPLFPIMEQLSLSNFRVILLFVTLFESHRGNGLFDTSKNGFQWTYDGYSMFLSSPYSLSNVVNRVKKSWTVKEWNALTQVIEPYLNAYSLNGKAYPIPCEGKQLDSLLLHKEPVAQWIGNLLFLMSPRKENDSFACLWSCLLSLSVNKKRGLYKTFLKLAPKESVKDFPESAEAVELVLFFLNSGHTEKIRLTKEAAKSLSEEDKDQLFEKLLLNNPNEAFEFFAGRENLSLEKKRHALSSLTTHKQALTQRTWLEGAKILQKLLPAREENKKALTEDIQLARGWASQMVLAESSEEAETLLNSFNQDFSPEDKKNLRMNQLGKASGRTLKELVSQSIKEEWFAKQDSSWKTNTISRFINALDNKLPTEDEWSVIQYGVSNQLLDRTTLFPLVKKTLSDKKPLPETLLLPLLTKVIETTERLKRKEWLEALFSSPTGVALFGKIVSQLPENLVKAYLEDAKDPLHKLSDQGWKLFCDPLIEKTATHLRSIFPTLENESLDRLMLFQKIFPANTIEEDQLLFGAKILANASLSNKKKLLHAHPKLADTVTFWCRQLFLKGKVEQAENLQKKYNGFLSDKHRKEVALSSIQALIQTNNEKKVKEAAIHWIKDETTFKRILGSADETDRKTIIRTFLKSVSSNVPTREECAYLTFAHSEHILKQEELRPFLTKDPESLLSLPSEQVKTLIQIVLDDQKEKDLHHLTQKLLSCENCTPFVRYILKNSPSPIKESLYETLISPSSIGLEQKFLFAKIAYSSVKNRDLSKTTAIFFPLFDDPHCSSKKLLTEFFTSPCWETQSLKRAVNTFLLNRFEEKGASLTLSLIQTHSLFEGPFESSLLEAFDSFFENKGSIDLSPLLFAIKKGLCRDEMVWKTTLQQHGKDEQVWSAFKELFETTPSLLKKESEWVSTFLSCSCQLEWKHWNLTIDILMKGNHLHPSHIRQFYLSCLDKLNKTTIPVPEVKKLTDFLSRHGDEQLFLVWAKALQQIKAEEQKKLVQTSFKQIQKIVFRKGFVFPESFTFVFPFLTDSQKLTFFSTLSTLSTATAAPEKLEKMWTTIFNRCALSPQFFFSATTAFYSCYKPFFHTNALVTWKNKAFELLNTKKTFILEKKDIQPSLFLIASEVNATETKLLSLRLITDLSSRSEKPSLIAVGDCLDELCKLFKNNTFENDDSLLERFGAATLFFHFLQQRSSFADNIKAQMCCQYLETTSTLLDKLTNPKTIPAHKFPHLFLCIPHFVHPYENVREKVDLLINKIPNLTEPAREEIHFVLSMLRKEKELPPLKKMERSDRKTALKKIIKEYKTHQNETSFFFILDLIKNYACPIFKEETPDTLLSFLEEVLQDLSNSPFPFQSEPNDHNLLIFQLFENKNSNTPFYEQAYQVFFSKEIVQLLTEEKQQELQQSFLLSIAKGNRFWPTSLSSSFGQFALRQLSVCLQSSPQLIKKENFIDQFNRLVWRFSLEVIHQTPSKTQDEKERQRSFFQKLFSTILSIEIIDQEEKNKFLVAIIKSLSGASIEKKDLLSQRKDLEKEIFEILHILVLDFCNAQINYTKNKNPDFSFLATIQQIINGNCVTMDYLFANLAFDYWALRAPGSISDLQSFSDNHLHTFFNRLCTEKVCHFIFLNTKEEETHKSLLQSFRENLFYFLVKVDQVAPNLVGHFTFSIAQRFLNTRFLLLSEEQEKKYVKPILKEVILLLGAAHHNSWFNSADPKESDSLRKTIKELSKIYAPEFLKKPPLQ